MNNDVLKLMEKGRQDYGWFMTHVLDVKSKNYWAGMDRVNRSVRDNERTAVGAGHGVSKTYNLARLALTFLYCYVPSTVVTTAPTGTQVKDLLWRELRDAYSHARIKLGGKLTTSYLDMQPATGLRWFATGISVRPDTITKEATRFQGYHNEHLLIIFDEAMGVLPEIWRAAEHIGAPFKRFVAVGNVTSSSGDFVEALDDPTYNEVRISIKETPNYLKGKKIIPGVYGQEYVRRITTKYGKNSDEMKVRVEGKTSEKGAEGAYYGKELRWLEKHQRITKVSFDNRYPVYTVMDPGYMTAMWFLQFRGMDVAVIRAEEHAGIGADGWAELLRALSKQEGYRYGAHYAPFDIESNQYKAVAGKTLLESFAENGIDLTTLDYEYRVNDGIERTRKFINRCWFDRDLCKHGLKALKNYHEKKIQSASTEDNPVFAGYPDKQFWGIHLADAFRYVSMAVHKTSSKKMTKQQYRELKAKYDR